MLTDLFVLAFGSAAAQDKPSLKDQKEKISYIIGMDIGANFKKQSIEIDPDILAKGIKDGLSGAKPLTSASINPAYAWYIHMEGARMFYGGKEQLFLLWPVRGESYNILPATGQTQCYDVKGNCISCTGWGQDGEFCKGHEWPIPRFETVSDAVIDHLTGLCWLRHANLTEEQFTWEEALQAIAKYNRICQGKFIWRLPNINELESLVDCSMHSPALPKGHPFIDVQEGYWSSTTSVFEPDWAWALYLTKGAVGVGQKLGSHFHVWTVGDAHDTGS